MNAHAALFIRIAQWPRHGQRLKCLEDLPGILALRARLQAAVRLQVALARVHVDHEENAAEEPEQLIELREDLLEKKVVRLHHKNRARRAVSEFARDDVIAEVHPAVEARSVD